MSPTRHIKKSLSMNFLHSLSFLFAMVALGFASLDANAQVVVNMKLNPSLLADEDVTTARLSPDGNWIVYLTDQASSNVVTLYSVPAAGGTAFKFAEAIDLEIQNLEQLRFSISPDSQWIIFTLYSDPDNTIDIYRAPIAGGTPQLLCPPLSFDSGVRMLSISQDSKWVVYQSNPDGNTWHDVFSVPISGGDPIKLNQLPNVFWVEVNPNSDTVIYQSQEESFYFDLYSVPISGGPSTKLNGALSENVSTDSFFHISSDGNWVVYEALLEETGRFPNLFSVESSGGNSVKLNLPFEYEGYVSSWSMSQNSDYVLLGTRERPYDGALPVSKHYSVPIGGGTPVRLDNFNVDPSTYEIHDFGSSRDGLVALFTQQSRDTYYNAAGIYSVPFSGGTPTRLDTPDILGVDEELGWWHDLLPGNENLLVTTTVKGMFHSKNIYNISLPDGSITKLSHDLGANEFLQMALEPTPLRIFYTTRPSDTFSWQETTGLYTVGLGGGNVIQMNGDFVEGGHMGVIARSSDSRTIYYLADQNTDEIYELYSSTLTCYAEQPHSADSNQDYLIALSELLRSIQFYNIGAVSCMDGTEDGYFAGSSGDFSCNAFSGDYNPQDWTVDISELLRLIQLYNGGYYYACPGVGEDGFCPCEL